MIRRLFAVFVAAALLLSSIAYAQEMQPEWTYAISPEIVQNNTGYITLANHDTRLSADYEPQDLVYLSVKRTVSDAQLRKIANEALQQMFSDAQAAGYTLYVKSAYRSYQTQNTMYSNRLDKMGYDDGLVTPPGGSDHQTGLGVDVLNYEWTKKDGMNAAFANTAEAQWMAEHCQEYGFIIRYREDKEDITKIKFEPWHLRYVGLQVAAYMTENNLCLEEFTQESQAYLASYEEMGGNVAQLVRERSMPGDTIILDTGEDGEDDYSVFY